MTSKETQIKKLKKYLNKAEIELAENILDPNNSLSMNALNGAFKFLKETEPFASLKMDHKNLSLLLITLEHDIRILKGKWQLNKTIRPVLLSGSNELLKALDLYKKHPYNIEKIIIIGKGYKQIGNEEKNQPLIQLRKTKDVQPIKYSVIGIESIMKLFRLIEENKKDFEIFAKREDLSYSELNSQITKGKIEPHLRRKYRKKISNYLIDQLPTGYSLRKIFIMGGLIFEKLEIMPPRKSNIKTKDQIENFLADNFRKDLKLQ